MRVLGCVLVALALAGVLCAQNQNAIQPGVTRGFGSVVFPGGTGASMPGVQRTLGSVVFPGGGGPQIVVPPFGGAAVRSNPAGRRNTAVWAYPIYMGGIYDSSYYSPTDQTAPQQQPQNVTVVYPPQAAPVVINQYGLGGAATPAQAGMSIYSEPANRVQDTAPEPDIYLLAFKDHSVYGAVAYWVDGDTLHYFMPGNQHNQASVSLVDRDMTARLNKASGMEVKLPAEK